MNLLFFLLLEDQPSLSNVCPALHGRKVKGFERAGAPTVPRSGLEDGAKICIGLAMSMVCLWSMVRRPMSVLANYILSP